MQLRSDSVTNLCLVYICRSVYRMNKIDDDWDGGGSDSDGLDITDKPRPPSPAKLAQIYKVKPPAHKEEYKYENKPSFVCQIDDELPSQIVMANPPNRATKEPPLGAETVEIDDEMYLRVLYNGVLQCKWRLERRTRELAENEYFFVAQSYTWSDESRVFHALTFVNDFTGEKEFGYNQNFYGKDIFGKKWRTIHTAAVEALAPAEYKQFVTDKKND